MLLGCLYVGFGQKRRRNWQANCSAEAGNDQFIRFGWLTPMAIKNSCYFLEFLRNYRKFFRSKGFENPSLLQRIFILIISQPIGEQLKTFFDALFLNAISLQYHQLVLRQFITFDIVSNFL
jgi:hypothetical protein